MMKNHAALIALALASSYLFGCGARRPQRALAPTSTAYQLCELDLHCPAGSYCSAGVCDVDCHADADCHGGQACDARGRCLLPSVRPTPPRFAGHLAVGASRLAVSVEEPTATVLIGDDGAGPIGRFHAVSDDPAVSATPAGGTLVPGQSLAIQIHAAPGWTGPAATIHLLSTGGSADLAIRLTSALVGRLEGTVQVVAPFAMGESPLALELGGLPAALSGTVDGAASLLWPVNAAARASDSVAAFQVSFAFVAAPGDPGDPLLGGVVRRTVALKGSHTGPASVAGTYIETIDGLPGGAVTTSGTFTLRRVGPSTGLAPIAAAPFFPAAVPSLPMACQCTDPTCPSPSGTAANEWFFVHGFPFERWATGSSYSNGSCVLPGGQSGACVVPEAAACALGGFAAQGSVGAPGLVDALRAQASYALLAGKDGLAEVLQPVGPAIGGRSLAQEIAQLETAAGLLGDGLHGTLAGASLLSPAGCAAARALPASAFAQTTRDRSALDDVQRFGGAVAARLFAEAQAQERIERQGGAPAVLALAQRTASGALIDLAAIGAIVAPSGLLPDGSVAPAPEQVLGLAAAFEPVVLGFDRVEQGLNPVGYRDDYVPFAYDPAQPTLDLFEQLVPLAQRYLAAAQADELRLVTDSREFDHDASALASALAAVGQRSSDTIVALCGPVADPTSAVGCGANGGKIKEAVDEERAAKVAIQEATGRSSAAAAKVVLLNGQLAQETADEKAEIELVTTDGQVVVAAALAQAYQREADDIQNCANATIQCVLAAVFTDGMSLINEGPPGGICARVLDDLVFKSVANATQAAQAQASAQVALLKGQVEIHDDQMKVEVQDAVGSSATASDEVVRQAQLFDAANQRLRDLIAQVRQTLADERTAEAQSAAQATADPTYRLYRDADAAQWAADLSVARRWTFLATRALEYTLAASFARAGEVFTDESAQSLSDYLLALQDAHDTDQLANGWDQERDDLVSLRQDVFGIQGPRVDPVTGATLTPAEQFQALVALPANRDPATGNLQIRFATSVTQGNGVFSTDVAEDRIAGLKIGLVGSQLAGRTAYVSLAQAGLTTVRASDGTLVPFQLDPKIALVPSGINPATFQDPSLPESTDLYARPVAAAAWTLGLDQLADPRNAAVDLAALEDVEIWIHHRARTLQAAP